MISGQHNNLHTDLFFLKKKEFSNSRLNHRMNGKLPLSYYTAVMNN